MTYNDTPNAVSVSTAADLLVNGDHKLQTTTSYDSLGRVIQTQNPDGNCVATTYDGRTRLATVSNPGPCGNQAYFTTITYDGLNRVRTVTAPATNSSVHAVTENRYAGPSTLTIDASGKTRQTTSDALGRLIQVVENQTSWAGQPVGVSSESALTTTYGYDVLDDLTSVSQGALQQRNFTYDSLKRLVQATNLESGTTNYAYDDSGNLRTRKFTQSAQTGQITVSMTYDGMNRILTKTYAGGGTSTPGVTYCYDGKALDPIALSCGTTASASGSYLGHLSGEGSTATTSNITNFSNRGFVLGSQQTTLGKDYSFSYTYGPSGALTTITYPSQRTVSYSLDNAGRVQQIQNGTGKSAPSYASNIQYEVHNGIKQLTLGNGVAETTVYSQDRLTPISITAANSSTFLALTYNHCLSGSEPCAANTGNVYTQTMTRPNGSWSQTYTYDSLNRLTSAQESSTGSWAEGYVYDAYGNRALCVANSNPTQTCILARSGLPALTYETVTTTTPTVGN